METHGDRIPEEKKEETANAALIDVLSTGGNPSGKPGMSRDEVTGDQEMPFGGFTGDREEEPKGGYQQAKDGQFPSTDTRLSMNDDPLTEKSPLVSGGNKKKDRGCWARLWAKLCCKKEDADVIAVDDKSKSPVKAGCCSKGRCKNGCKSSCFRNVCAKRTADNRPLIAPHTKKQKATVFDVIDKMEELVLYLTHRDVQYGRGFFISAPMYAKNIYQALVDIESLLDQAWTVYNGQLVRRPQLAELLFKIAAQQNLTKCNLSTEESLEEYRKALDIVAQALSQFKINGVLNIDAITYDNIFSMIRLLHEAEAITQFHHRADRELPSLYDFRDFAKNNGFAVQKNFSYVLPRLLEDTKTGMLEVNETDIEVLTTKGRGKRQERFRYFYMFLPSLLMGAHAGYQTFLQTQIYLLNPLFLGPINFLAVVVPATATPVAYGTYNLGAKSYVTRERKPDRPVLFLKADELEAVDAILLDEDNQLFLDVDGKASVPLQKPAKPVLQKSEPLSAVTVDDQSLLAGARTQEHAAPLVVDQPVDQVVLAGEGAKKAAVQQVAKIPAVFEVNEQLRLEVAKRKADSAKPGRQRGVTGIDVRLFVKFPIDTSNQATSLLVQRRHECMLEGNVVMVPPAGAQVPLIESLIKITRVDEIVLHDTLTTTNEAKENAIKTANNLIWKLNQRIAKIDVELAKPGRVAHGINLTQLNESIVELTKQVLASSVDVYDVLIPAMKKMEVQLKELGKTLGLADDEEALFQAGNVRPGQNNNNQ
ncbi:MAG TPA: hypothetical protein VGV92_03190 [Gammaproteobacteria bacterium]|nr:hypothetical protein [Gammaproteobacteria bacterium]